MNAWLLFSPSFYTVLFLEAPSRLPRTFHSCSQRTQCTHTHITPSSHSSTTSLPGLAQSPSHSAARPVPSSQGCPPVLGWHRLQGARPHLVITAGRCPRVSEGPGQAGDCNEQNHHWRTDRHCGMFSELRMCPSKWSYLWSRTRGNMGKGVFGWNGRKAETWSIKVTW